MSPVIVSDIEHAIAKRFPPERAEAWDRVGLLAGDPQAVVTGVALALDSTREAIAEAARLGANVLVTHHPAFLEPPSRLAPGAGPGGVLFDALTAGIALINAHTNLDRDLDGQRLLPVALGLEPARALERSAMPMAIITVYVPQASVAHVIDSMTAAGAGRLGDYERCSFTVSGTGAFTPGADASPFIDTPAEPSIAEEERLEMVCPRSKVRAVVASAEAAHPYEHPLITATDVVIARNGAALGMICGREHQLTLRALATLAAGTFNITPRLWGDPDAPVGIAVTATGSAGSLIGEVLGAGADTLICGEVRYHDALDARGEGLAIVELGHDVSEWPLVTLLEQTVNDIPGLDRGTVHPLPARPAWWTT